MLDILNRENFIMFLRVYILVGDVDIKKYI